MKLHRIFKIIILIILSFSFTGLKRNAGYKKILKSGIKPKIKSDYEFPVSKQYQNGCFGFAVKNVVKYKYDINIDLKEAEKKINKPRNDLWTAEHIRNFLKEYNLNTKWYESAYSFFYFLSKGEPVIIQYKYFTSKNYWVGHFVAVYSFDQKGVWISETIEGKRKRITYDKVFSKEGRYTVFAFAVVEKTK